MTAITLYIGDITASFDEHGAAFSGQADFCRIDVRQQQDPDVSAISSAWWAMDPTSNPFTRYRTTLANQSRRVSPRVDKLSEYLRDSEATMFNTDKGDFFVPYRPKLYNEASSFIMGIAMAGKGLCLRLETYFSVSRDNPYSDHVTAHDWVQGQEPILCSRVSLHPWDKTNFPSPGSALRKDP